MARQHSAEYVQFIQTHGPESCRPVLEPAAPTSQQPGQLLPGSEYSEWATSDEVFLPIAEAVEAFKQRWSTKILNKIAARGGRLRLRVTLEWVPQSKSS